MENKFNIADNKEIEALERIVEFTIERAEELNLNYSASLLKIAKKSIIEEFGEVIEVVELNS